jgi:hypothetical protein
MDGDDGVFGLEDGGREDLEVPRPGRVGRLSRVGVVVGVGVDGPQSVDPVPQ